MGDLFGDVDHRDIANSGQSGSVENHVNMLVKPILKERTNGGFMVFKREFFDYIKEKEFEHPALKRLVDKKELSVYVHDGFFHAMDTYTDVDDLNEMWRQDPQWKVW